MKCYFNICLNLTPKSFDLDMGILTPFSFALRCTLVFQRVNIYVYEHR
jgi:hypothetical protein